MSSQNHGDHWSDPCVKIAISLWDFIESSRFVICTVHELRLYGYVVRFPKVDPTLGCICKSGYKVDTHRVLGLNKFIDPAEGCRRLFRTGKNATLKSGQRNPCEANDKFPWLAVHKAAPASAWQMTSHTQHWRFLAAKLTPASDRHIHGHAVNH